MCLGLYVLHACCLHLPCRCACVLPAAAVGTPGPCYWGFTVAANLLPVLAPAIQACKLLSVFDIDETLLMAHTVDSLNSRLSRISRER